MPTQERLFDVYQLPDQQNAFLADWDVVYLPDQTKNLLLDYVHTLNRLRQVHSPGLALRRAVLLYGPPGCGKTSLARGLPAKWCILAQERRVGFIHVNTHALFSGIRGEGQKNVLEAFQKIAEQATSGYPIFVLIDEVETLGTDRASISLEANPLDALYQVTAFFESLDKLARELPNLIFIFTTNIPKAIDRAVRERVDFVLEIPLPEPEQRSMILADAIRSLRGAFDVGELLNLATANPPQQAWIDVISATHGLSGRTLRHLLVLAATMAARSKTLQPDHLLQAITTVGRAEEGLLANAGTYVEPYQQSVPAPATGPVLPAPAALNGSAEIQSDLSRLRTYITAEMTAMREMLTRSLARPRPEAPPATGVTANPPGAGWPHEG